MNVTQKVNAPMEALGETWRLNFQDIPTAASFVSPDPVVRRHAAKLYAHFVLGVDFTAKDVWGKEQDDNPWQDYSGQGDTFSRVWFPATKENFELTTDRELVARVLSSSLDHYGPDGW